MFRYGYTGSIGIGISGAGIAQGSAWVKERVLAWKQVVKNTTIDYVSELLHDWNSIVMLWPRIHEKYDIHQICDSRDWPP